jgi:hypothetical protein
LGDLVVLECDKVLFGGHSDRSVATATFPANFIVVVAAIVATPVAGRDYVPGPEAAWGVNDRREVGVIGFNTGRGSVQSTETVDAVS